MALAWHVAFLTAYAPAKARRFPKLDGLLIKAEPRRGRQRSWEEDFAAMSAWASSRRAKS